MKRKRNQRQSLHLSTVLPAGVIFVFVVGLVFYEHLNPQDNTDQHVISPVTDTKAASTPDKKQHTQLVRYGYQLLTHTAQFIGPDVPDTAMRFTGNHLSCTNCHLDAGRKLFSAPFINVIQRYPRFMGRADTIVSIEGRINGCMQRSMNGRPLPVKSTEMKAIVAYFRSLNEKGKPKTPPGTGFLSIKLPDRAANLTHGKSIFISTCIRCHGRNGSGKLNSVTDSSKGYLYPPLWGHDSFNQGAGMHRVITAARFIKGNMPFGTTYNKPKLTDAEAFDVAAYINDQPRPDLPGKRNDYPDLTKKPIDCPYPPYADSLSQHRHQFGPFVTKQHRAE